MNKQEALEAAKLKSKPDYNSNNSWHREWGGGFNTGFRAGVEYAERWTPIVTADDLPAQDGWYLWQRRFDKGATVTHIQVNRPDECKDNVEDYEAYMPLPAPYQPKGEKL